MPVFCPCGQVKYKFNIKNTCPNDMFTCPKKKKSYFVFWKSHVHNTLLACPIQATYFLVFQMLARILLLVAPGNWASAFIYVAPCICISVKVGTMNHYCLLHQKFCLLRPRHTITNWPSVQENLREIWHSLVYAEVRSDVVLRSLFFIFCKFVFVVVRSVWRDFLTRDNDKSR